MNLDAVNDPPHGEHSYRRLASEAVRLHCPMAARDSACSARVVNCSVNCTTNRYLSTGRGSSLQRTLDICVHFVLSQEVRHPGQEVQLVLARARAPAYNRRAITHVELLHGVTCARALERCTWGIWLLARTPRATADPKRLRSCACAGWQTGLEQGAMGTVSNLTIVRSVCFLCRHRRVL